MATKIVGFKTPKEVAVALSQVGCIKAKLSWEKTFVMAFLAGCYVAYGALLAITVGGGLHGWGAANPGIQKFMFGAVFPLGLIFVIVAGSELWTGNLAVLMPGLLARKITPYEVMRNWVLVYLGNFAGSLFVAYFLAYLTDLVDKDPWKTYTINIADRKCNLGWGVTFLRAIGCNWMVCLAVWLASAADTMGGKILAIWWPIMGFATIGYEHTVANMFLVPLGLMAGAVHNVGDFIGTNLIPSMLGNMIGGSLFVGAMYWYIYVRDDEMVQQKKTREEAEKKKWALEQQKKTSSDAATPASVGVTITTAPAESTSAPVAAPVVASPTPAEQRKESISTPDTPNSPTPLLPLTTSSSSVGATTTS